MEETERSEPQKKSGKRFSCVSCQGCSCLFFLIVGLLCVGFAYLIVKKPTNYWSRFVDFMNADIEIPEISESGLELSDVEDKIDDQINSLDDIKLTLTEEEFNILAKDSMPGLESLVVDLESDKVNFYWIIDNTIQDKPLYGVATLIKKNDSEVLLDRIGTKRIASPKFINDFVAKGTLDLLKIDNKERSDDLILEILQAENNFEVKSVDFDKDEITLTLDSNIRFRRD